MSENGRLRDDELRDTQIGGRLEERAARSADRMALAFAMDRGEWLYATDTYRTRKQQEDLWNGPKRHLAAPPGTSVHGTGEAVDFRSGVNVRSSAAHKWMDANAHKFGWFNPNWATPGKPGFQKDEAWHYEYEHDMDRMQNAPSIKMPKGDDLGVGSSGAQVRKVQGLLNKRLKSDIAVDGEFGFGTAAAVAKFQKANGLHVSGVVGGVTLEHLEGKVREPKARVIYLKKGTRKTDQVRKLQEFLRKTGPNKRLAVDGDFGPATEAAVRVFQTRHALAHTGMVGPETKEALEAAGLEL